MTPQIESLDIARFHAHLATRNLQEALAESDPVAALALYPMIATAANLARDIEALIHAVWMQKKEVVYQD